MLSPLREVDRKNFNQEQPDQKGWRQLTQFKGNQTGRGGFRKGAGRKPGSLTKRTNEIAQAAAASGLTPLEVMLKAMQQHVEAKSWDEAAKIAQAAAPYMHPRLASVDMTSKNETTVHILSDKPLSADEWEQTYSVGAPTGTTESTH